MAPNSWPSSYRLPMAPVPQALRGYSYGVPIQMGYEEVVFDRNRGHYITLRQQEEITRLREELKTKQKTKSENVKNIIGYFYLRKR